MNLIKIDFVNKKQQDCDKKYDIEFPLAVHHLKNQTCIPNMSDLTSNWNRTFRILLEHVNDDSLLSKVYMYNSLMKKHSQGQLSFGERKMLSVSETYLVKAGLIK